jgi:phosphohistidine swiveling domain-containing protein
MNLKSMTNNQLSQVFKKINYLQMLSHGYAICTTWFVDSDGEDFSHFLMERIEDIIKAQKSKMSSAEVFSILTTPTRPSLAIKEEIESLKVLQSIKAESLSRKIFLQSDVKEIKKSLVGLKPKLKRKILNHYKKWHWTPYTYIGPPYDLDYYLTVWSGLLRQKLDINRHLQKLQNQPKFAKLAKQKLIKKLKISKNDQQLFDIASEIIYLKAYRKDCWFFGCFVMERIHKEIAKRLNLSLKQVRFMAHWEVPLALKKGNFSEQILNERIRFCVYYQKNLKGIIYIGKRARQFLSKLNIEKEVIKEVNELSGTSACPGKVKGTIKIINQPEQMGKMNQGDIMIAHTTFPSLVPAMKKAAAIITDDGGITCHAAIVARELKTPCVVGTKIVTKVLKDGDRVEVDAERGIVRKIK